MEEVVELEEVVVLEEVVEMEAEVAEEEGMVVILIFLVFVAKFNPLLN